MSFSGSLRAECATGHSNISVACLRQPRARLQPRLHISSPVTNGSPDLHVLRPFAEQPPFTQAAEAHVQVVGNLTFGHHLDFRLLRSERWFRWPLGDNRFWLATGQPFQFGDPQVEPFDFLEGDQVHFTQEFDDLGLVWGP